MDLEPHLTQGSLGPQMFNGRLSRTTQVSWYQKGAKTIWKLLKQETVSDSGISWAVCKSAPRSRQITMPARHHSAFLQAGCPSYQINSSVKALKAQLIHMPNTHTQTTLCKSVGTWHLLSHMLASVSSLSAGKATQTSANYQESPNTSLISHK